MLNEDILGKLDQIATQMQRQNDLMERWLETMHRQENEWCDPDEACRLLGIPVTKSGSSRRKLTALIRRGKITQYQEGNPRRYYKKELKKLSQELREGDLVI